MKKCFSLSGEVTYNATGFCDKNRDILFPDLIKLMKSSQWYVLEPTALFITQYSRTPIKAPATKAIPPLWHGLRKSQLFLISLLINSANKAPKYKANPRIRQR